MYIYPVCEKSEYMKRFVDRKFREITHPRPFDRTKDNILANSQFLFGNVRGPADDDRIINATISMGKFEASQGMCVIINAFDAA